MNCPDCNSNFFSSTCPTCGIVVDEKQYEENLFYAPIIKTEGNVTVGGCNIRTTFDRHVVLSNYGQKIKHIIIRQGTHLTLKMKYAFLLKKIATRFDLTENTCHIIFSDYEKLIKMAHLSPRKQHIPYFTAVLYTVLGKEKRLTIPDVCKEMSFWGFRVIPKTVRHILTQFNLMSWNLHKTMKTPIQQSIEWVNYIIPKLPIDKRQLDLVSKKWQSYSTKLNTMYGKKGYNPKLAVIGGLTLVMHSCHVVDPHVILSTQVDRDSGYILHAMYYVRRRMAIAVEVA